MKQNKYQVGFSVGYRMIIPAVILILLINIYPFFNALYLSFTGYNLLRSGSNQFIGLKNFVNIFTSGEYYRSFAFSFVNTISVVAISFIFGLILALLLNNEIRFKPFFRGLMLVPWLIPAAVMGSVFSLILNDQFGVVNRVLLNIGLIEKPILFLANPTIAKFTVIGVQIWKSTPFMFIILLAGLQSIPKEYYEAARVDGAGYFRILFSIILPSIKPVTFIGTTLLFIWTFNNFENIYLLTQGGPAKGTFVLTILSYFMAFLRGKLGYASAIAVTIMILITALVIVYLKLQGEERMQ